MFLFVDNRSAGLICTVQLCGMEWDRVIKGSYSILIFSRVFFWSGWTGMEMWANRVSSNYFHICWYYTHTHTQKCPIQNHLKWTGFQMNICIWRSICSWYKYNTLSFTANFHCCWHTSNTWNISESRDREKNLSWNTSTSPLSNGEPSSRYAQPCASKRHMLRNLPPPCAKSITLQRKGSPLHTSECDSALLVSHKWHWNTQTNLDNIDSAGKNPVISPGSYCELYTTLKTTFPIQFYFSLLHNNDSLLF